MCLFCSVLTAPFMSLVSDVIFASNMLMGVYISNIKSIL